MEWLDVVSPLGGETIKGEIGASRLNGLDGKTIGETWNEDFKGDTMFPIYRELFKARYRDVKIIPYTEFPASLIRGTAKHQREVAREIARLAKERGCDALISGNGG